MKKSALGKKMLALLTACCLIVSMLFIVPFSASAAYNNDHQFRYNGTNFTLSESGETVNILYKKDVSADTVLTALESRNAKKGIKIDFTNIITTATSYSMAMQFGNAKPTKGQTVSSNGFLVLYSSNGEFNVVTTPTVTPYNFTAITTDTAHISQTVAPLTDKFSLEILLNSNKTYSIKLTDSSGNKKTVTYNPSSTGLTDFDNLSCAYGLSTALYATSFSEVAKVPKNSGFSVKVGTSDIDYGTTTPPNNISCGFSNFYFKENNGNLTVTRMATGGAYERFDYKNPYSLENDGLLFNIKDISTDATGYTLAFGFGASANIWTDKHGIMMFYDTDGDFSVINSVGGSPNDADVLACGKTSTSDEVALGVKIVGSNYIFSLNDSTFTVDADVLSQSKQVYVSIGVMSSYSLNTSTSDISNLKYWEENFISTDAAFTIIGDIGKLYKEEEQGGEDSGDEPEEQGTATAPEGITATTAGGFLFKQQEKDLLVTSKKTNQGWERFGFKTSYLATDDGVTVSVKDAVCPVKTYSHAVFIKSDGVGWYDTKGCMVLFDADGDFAIIGVSGEKTESGSVKDLNKEPLLAADKLTYTGDFKLNVKQLADDSYVFSVGGKEYPVAAEYLNASDEIFINFGIVGNFTLSGDFKTLSNLSYASAPKDKNLTFVIEQIVGKSSAEDIPTGTSTPPENFSVVGSGNFLFDNKDNNLYITSLKECAGWERLSYKIPYLVSESGATFKVDNIECRSKNWSFAIYISDKQGGWYDKKGIFALYSCSGNLAFLGTDGAVTEKGDLDNLNNKEVLQADKIEYSNSITMNIKQNVNDDYIINFNGKDYPISKEWLNSSDEVYFTFGTVSDFNIESNFTKISDLNYAYATRSKYLKFRFLGVDGVQPQDEAQIYVGSETAPDYIKAEGKHFRYIETEKGLQITHTYDGAAYERVCYTYGYLVNEEVTLNITDIKSRAKTFSIAVGIGGGGAMWYDTKGILLFYDRNGNIAVTESTGIPNETGGPLDPNKANLIASAHLEQFSNSLAIKIRKSGSEYLFNVNGVMFTAPASMLDDSDQVTFSFGVMSNFTIDNNDLQGLKYWQNDYKNKNVSFTVSCDGISTKDDPITAKKLDKEQSGIGIVGDGIGIYEHSEGLMFIHYGGGASWERAYYLNKFSPVGAGIHFAVKNITSKAKDYSIAVKIGSKGTWYDDKGYQIIYGKSGNFSIVATAKEFTNPNISPVLVDTVREPLGSEYTLDIALKGTNYQITVNGISYTVPAQHNDYPVENMRELTLSFGIMNDARIGQIRHASSSFKNNNVSFVITEASGMIPPEDLGDPFDMKVVGYHWSLSSVPNGTKLTMSKGGTGLERVSTKKSFSMQKGGTLIKLTDIYSTDPNYSAVIMLSDKEDPWYDCAGYMLVYDKSGNFSIVATDSSVINPQKSTVMVAEKRESLGNDLSVNVRLAGRDYKITVNGKTYSVDAKNKSYPIENRENLYVGFGAFSAGKIENVVYNDLFLKDSLSYTVDSIVHNEKLAVKETEVKTEKDSKTVDDDYDDDYVYEPKDDNKTDNRTDEVSKEVQPESSSKVLLWIIIAAVAVLGAGIGIFFIIKAKKR